MDQQLTPSIVDVKNSIGIKAILITNLYVNICGGIMHSGLVLVTAKNKKLHSTCHLLLGLNSLSICLAYCIPLAPLATIILAPQFHPSNLQCFLAQMPFLFANFHFFSLMPSIGLDRMLSAFWPLWYVSRNDLRYLIYLLVLSMLFPLFIVWNAFDNMLPHPNQEMTCTMGELLGQHAFMVSIYCLLCILISTIIYAIVYIRLKMDIRKSLFRAQNWHSIFKSLCVILCLQVGGWLLGQLAYAVVYLNSHLISPLTRWQITLSVLCFQSAVAAFDVPVLIYTSTTIRIMSAIMGYGNPSIPDVKNSLVLKLIFFGYFTINLIGGIMHFALVLIKIKNRKFHATCNLLLALNSVSVLLAYCLILTPLAFYFYPASRARIIRTNGHFGIIRSGAKGHGFLALGNYKSVS